MSGNSGNRKRLAGVAIALLFVAAVPAYLIFHTHESRAQAPDSKGETADSINVAPDTTLDPFDSLWLADPLGGDFIQRMERIQTRMNQMFGEAFDRLGTNPKFKSLVGEEAYAPKLDLQDAGKKFVVTVDLPGVDSANLEISVDDQTLTISGKREEITEERDAKGTVVRNERRLGAFSRSVMLPEAVQADQMTSTYKDGVLTIELPKKGASI